MLDAETFSCASRSSKTSEMQPLLLACLGNLTLSRCQGGLLAGECRGNKAIDQAPVGCVSGVSGSDRRRRENWAAGDAGLDVRGVSGGV